MPLDWSLAFVPDLWASVEPEHGKDLFAGVRYITHAPFLRLVTLAQTLSQASYQGLVLALPVMAFVRYSLNPKVAGILEGSWGVGALVGSLVAFWLVRRANPLMLSPAA